MMAQEMYSENQELESKIESIRILLDDIDDFLRECNVQTAEEDRRIGDLQERIKSIDEDVDADEEACEECRMWKPQCECEVQFE